MTNAATLGEEDGYAELSLWDRSRMTHNHNAIGDMWKDRYDHLKDRRDGYETGAREFVKTRVKMYS
jgi:hypothetical protein